MAIEPSRRRITVTLPAALLDRLDARVPLPETRPEPGLARGRRDFRDGEE